MIPKLSLDFEYNPSRKFHNLVNTDEMACSSSYYEEFESELTEGNFAHHLKKLERDEGSFGLPIKITKNKSKISGSSIDSDMRVEYSSMEDDIDDSFEKIEFSPRSHQLPRIKE
jgi:hypothetical protein